MSSKKLYLVDGYFTGTHWDRSGPMSPLIDAGHPDMACGDEPRPNGGRINMGAYGGTSAASVSDVAVGMVLIAR